MMGLEEHLLTMFRDDFEFGNDAAPSHLAAVTGPNNAARPCELVAFPAALPPAAPLFDRSAVGWSKEAEDELHKIPFFVRGKARRNAERFAQERGVALISVETLYDAKAHFAR
jgi:light-independent protochlorophyllide reductase subunit B